MFIHMGKSIFAVIMALIASCSLTGQQTPHFTQIALNKYVVNPAYAGFDKSLSINATYRSQWSGLEANPKQFNINAHLPLYFLNGGAGINLSGDQLGTEKNTRIMASFNRVFTIPNGVLSIAAASGLHHKQINGSLFITPDGIYEPGFTSHMDPILTEVSESAIAPVWTLGLYVGHRYFEAGLAVSDLGASDLSYAGFTYKQSRNINMYAQSHIEMGPYLVSPFAFVNTNLGVWQASIGTIIKSGNIFGGVSIRGFNENSLDAVSLVGGIRLSKFYIISYGFDIGLSELRKVSEGSHEILLKYNLNKLLGIGLPPKIIYNPRDL